MATAANDFLKKIEHSFDEKPALTWMSNYWWLSFCFSAIYLLLIYYGMHFMKNRKPYDLRRALCMWSTGLAVFSFFAMLRIAPMFRLILIQGGFEFTVCDMNYLVGSNGRGIWAFLFPLSKLPELVDTAFIVLRKSKISFLHCYHHISVFIYCWFSYAFPISTGIWFGTVNYFVHAVMYSYYAVKASGRNPPRWVARCITMLQLSQMFFGMFLNYTAIRAFFLGKTCGMDSFTVAISLFFYVSYAILFLNFYYWTYIYKKPGAVKKPVATSNRVTQGEKSPYLQSVAAAPVNCSVITPVGGSFANGGIKHR